MSVTPDGPAATDLRTAAQMLRDGNTWTGRGLSAPLADLLEAAADLVTGGAPGAATMPVVARALAVAGVVTGRQSA